MFGVVGGVIAMVAMPLAARVEMKGSPRRVAPDIPGAHAIHEERSASNQAAIDRVNAELAEIEARIARARREERSLLDEVSLLDQELARSRAREKSARLMAEEEARLARVARARATALSQRLVATRARVALVLQAMYRASPNEGLTALLFPAPAGDESDADAGGSLLARRQVELAADLHQAAQAARQAEAEARRRSANSERLADNARERAAEALSARADRHRRLGALAADRRRAGELEEERALAEAGLLQGVVALSRAPPLGAPRVAAPRTDLAGLDGRRGRIPWPVEDRGKLRGSVGDIVNPRHGTRTLRHGILLELAEGTPLRAVAPGRVVFADWFKGFGRCLVIDHGQGWMSVQAHARVLEVRAGDDVEVGQLVGEVGDSGSLDGPRLYFQLTRETEPVNPLEWLER